MRLEGDALRRILEQQAQPVAIYDARGSVLGELSPARALQYIGSHFGVGNRIRVRHLRPCIEVARRAWRGGSNTMERIRNEWGVVIGAPKSGLQHRELPREN